MSKKMRINFDDKDLLAYADIKQKFKLSDFKEALEKYGKTVNDVSVNHILRRMTDLGMVKKDSERVYIRNYPDAVSWLKHYLSDIKKDVKSE